MSANRKQSVHQIVEHNNCMGCGFCEPLCPDKYDAIRLEYNKNLGHYIPHVDDSKCTECGICQNMCPGEDIDFDKLNIIQFGQVPKNGKVGNLINTYTGYSNDMAVRKGGASGGLITELLSFALEKKLIDAALVVTLDTKDAFEPNFIMAKNKDEIIQTQKSQYLPIPLGKAFRQIMDEDIKVAVVGLPCHMHALRKSQVLSRRLRERIIYSFGLFCFGTTRRTGVEYFLETHGINPDDVASIVFRSEGYPGKIKVKLKNDTIKTFNRGFEVSKWDLAEHTKLWTAFRAPFYMDRCFTCADGVSELADLSFGDPWLPEFKNEKNGQTLLVSRSEKGQELVDLAIKEQRITLTPIHEDKIPQSQGNGECVDATKDMASKFMALQLLNMKQRIPNYNYKSLNQRINWGKVVFYIFLISHNRLTAKRKLWGILQPLAFFIYGIDFVKRRLRKTFIYSKNANKTH